MVLPWLGHVLCNSAVCKQSQSNRELKKSNESYVSVDFHGSRATCSLVRGKSDCLPSPNCFLSWEKRKMCRDTCCATQPCANNSKVTACRTQEI